MRQRGGVNDEEAQCENTAADIDVELPSIPSKSRRRSSIVNDGIMNKVNIRFKSCLAPFLVGSLLVGLPACFIWTFMLYSVDNENEPCQQFAPVSFPDISSLSPVRRSRLQSVQQAIQHAWKGYHDHVLTRSSKRGFLLKDDLAPLSESGNSWLNYAATLHDSIDTLYLANLTAEYNEAVTLLISKDVQTTSLRVTKTFEYSLRVLGGLLGAYSVSADPRLLRAAEKAADSMLEGPFRVSPTALPRPFGMLAPSSKGVNMWQMDWWKGILYRIYARLYEWGRDTFTNEHHTNSLAGVGSFALEFSFLSVMSDNPVYRQASDAIFHLVKTFQAPDGTVPTGWNVMTGKPFSRSDRSFGSGGDSFYEYLLKVPALNDCLEEDSFQNEFCGDVDLEMLAMYHSIVEKSLRMEHVSTFMLDGERLSFPVDNHSSFHHLLCFLPGLLALGSANKDDSTLLSPDMELAKELIQGCHASYQVSKTGLGAESAFIRNGLKEHADSQSILEIVDPSFLLRPEYVESLFVLYRITKDNEFQEMAWNVFRSLEEHCRVEGGGYASLANVNDGTKKVDNMPSYFLAETLKYLLLMFAPDDYISLDEFVLTTEGHPLRKPKKIKKDGLSALCKGDKKIIPPVPMPWTLVAILFILAFMIIWVFSSLVTMIMCRICCGSQKTKRKKNQ